MTFAIKAVNFCAVKPVFPEFLTDWWGKLLPEKEVI